MAVNTSTGILRYDRGVISDIEKVYGRWTQMVLDSITTPPPRYYFRVNKLRIDPGSLLDMLREAGYRVYRDEFLEEALWSPIEGPFKLDDAECFVYADKRAAESVILGADLYWPGVQGLDECVRPGKEVGIAFVHPKSGRKIVVGIGVSNARYGERREKGIAVKTRKSLYRSITLRDTYYYVAGFIYEQSFPSMLATHLLDPEPGAVIVDMCAAPGGKLSHIYEYVGGHAKIYGFDHSKRKIARTREVLARLGHIGIIVRIADSRYLDKDFPGLRADYVLLDPPCSSIGVVPKIYDEKYWREIKSFKEYQQQFLRVAARILRKGGVLVYSTCTITFSENEGNVLYAVERLGFELEELKVPRGVPSTLLPGSLRFHPHIHGNGYFIARLVKKK